MIDIRELRRDKGWTMKETERRVNSALKPPLQKRKTAWRSRPKGSLHDAETTRA